MKTTIKEIADYWLNERSEEQLALPTEDALTYCWRCYCHRKLQRCHIIPKSLGGDDSPENLVLLCAACHYEAPNHSNPKFMPIWIKSTRSYLQDSYWYIRALDTYESMFGKAFGENISINSDTIIQNRIVEWFKEETNNMIIHYGAGAVNDSTLACVLAEIESKIISEYGD